jgi:hypothetical protein
MEDEDRERAETASLEPMPEPIAAEEKDSAANAGEGEDVGSAAVAVDAVEVQHPGEETLSRLADRIQILLKRSSLEVSKVCENPPASRIIEPSVGLENRHLHDSFHLPALQRPQRVRWPVGIRRKALLAESE